MKFYGTKMNFCIEDQMFDTIWIPYICQMVQHVPIGNKTCTKYKNRVVKLFCKIR